MFKIKIKRIWLKNIFISLFPLWLYMTYVAGAYVMDNNVFEAMMTLFNTILLCFSLCIVINTARIFELIINSVLIFAFIICICGIVECFAQNNALLAYLAEPYIEIRNGIYRICTTFDHPIVYGNYLGIIMILTCFMFFRARRKKTRYMLIVLYILAAINLYLTVSRSALIIVVFTQILIFYFLEQRKGSITKVFKYFLFPLFGLYAIVSLMLSDSTGSSTVTGIFLDFKKGGITNIAALGDRLSLYIWVWDATKDNALLGNGLYAQLAYQKSDYFIKNSIEVEYLYTFFRRGFLGLTLLILSFISMLKYTIKNRFRNIKNKFDFNYFATFMLIGYYLLLFAVTRQSEQRIFYVFFCLCICYNRFLNRKEIKQ
jgi:hypothetical protein